MSLSLIGFIVVYGLVFITGYLYMIRLMRKGLGDDHQVEASNDSVKGAQ